MKPIYSFSNFETTHAEEYEDFEEDYIDDQDDDGLIIQTDLKGRHERRGKSSSATPVLLSPRNGNNASMSFGGHQRTGTVAGVTMNTLCNVMGAGVLALPLAFHNGSIVVSLILLVLSAYISLKAVHILGLGCNAVHRYSFTECVVLNLFPAEMEERKECIVKGIDPMLNSKRRLVATLLLEFVIVVESIGTLVVYTRVIADSLPPVVVGLGLDHPYVIFFISWILPSILFFLLSCSRSMEELKWTSLIGFGTILYIVVVVVVKYIEFVYVNSPSIFSDTGNATPPPSQSKIMYSQEGVRWFNLDIGCFSTMSTYALAYGYHFNVPYFYSELRDRNPPNLLKTVHYTLPIVTISYALTGVLGYLQAGESVAGKNGGNIVDSLDKMSFLVNVGRIGLLFHFATVYPVISVCARRGLHRLLALSALCVKEGGSIEDIEAKVSQDRMTDIGDADVPVTENSKLTEENKARYDSTELKTTVTSPSTTPIIGSRRPSIERGTQRTRFAEPEATTPSITPTMAKLGSAKLPRNFSVNSFSNLPTANRPAVPGDPQTTTISSIILEALFIVACSTLCAWYVPGVGLVIEVLGAFVGIPTMMVLPGIIGLRLFRDNTFANRWWMSHVRGSFPKEKKIAIMLIVVGTICTLFGAVGSLKGAPEVSKEQRKEAKEKDKERKTYLKDARKNDEKDAKS